jgi:hypothetical protein
MPNEILIKLASRSRPNKFVKCLNNIKQMTMTDYQVIVSADSDDKTMNCPQMIRFVDRMPRVKMFFGPHSCKVEAINRDIEKATPDWTILVNMSDDFEIVCRGWDRILRQVVGEAWPGSTDWFAHFSDGYVHEALPTISIMGRDYYNHDKYIYHPVYKSFSCDSEAYFVALARGKHKYFNHRLFKHEHPANNRRLKNDSLYRVNAIHSKDDIATYFERLNNDFDLGMKGPFPWDQYKTKVI